jgi:hypothetical protein
MVIRVISGWRRIEGSRDNQPANDAKPPSRHEMRPGTTEKKKMSKKTLPRRLFSFIEGRGALA